MPVSLLLCEGGASSPDIRVLRKILAGRCGVLASGGKYGMGERIRARREAIGRNEIFGILDGDFVDPWTPPVQRPVEWRSPDKTFIFGWRWERKEIENDLIDPEVVGPALNLLNSTLSVPDYRSALEVARDRLPCYQAARTALATSRLRFRDLESAFGKPRGSERHPFPDGLDEASCRVGLGEVVTQHQVQQTIKLDDVEAKFAQLLPEYQPGGPRHQPFLHAFSGKDLLWAMDGALRQLGFAGAWAFRERVLDGIDQSPDDVGAWLPEWGALQRAIDAV